MRQRWRRDRGEPGKCGTQRSAPTLHDRIESHVSPPGKLGQHVHHNDARRSECALRVQPRPWAASKQQTSGYHCGRDARRAPGRSRNGTANGADRPDRSLRVAHRHMRIVDDSRLDADRPSTVIEPRNRADCHIGYSASRARSSGRNSLHHRNVRTSVSEWTNRSQAISSQLTSRQYRLIRPSSATGRNRPRASRRARRQCPTADIDGAEVERQLPHRNERPPVVRRDAVRRQTLEMRRAWRSRRSAPSGSWDSAPASALHETIARHLRENRRAGDRVARVVAADDRRVRRSRACESASRRSGRDAASTPSRASARRIAITVA